jgi:hypothetical protein
LCGDLRGVCVTSEYFAAGISQRETLSFDCWLLCLCDHHAVAFS